jgi:hypothetical protein
VLIDSADWAGDGEEFIAALRRGVTQWVDTSTDGRRALLEGRGRITIADLAGYTPDCFIKGTQLANALIDNGIVMVTITVIEHRVNSSVARIDAGTNLYEGGQA